MVCKYYDKRIIDQVRHYLRELSGAQIQIELHRLQIYWDGFRQGVSNPVISVIYVTSIALTFKK